MDLQKELERIRQENADLRERLQKGEQRIEELLVRLNQDSRNSHWPPSRDKSRGKRKKRTRSRRKRSGKKAGAQKGHKGHTLVFGEEPDIVERHRPERYEHCHVVFDEAQQAVKVEKRQVYDLPPMRFAGDGTSGGRADMPALWGDEQGAISRRGESTGAIWSAGAAIGGLFADGTVHSL